MKARLTREKLIRRLREVKAEICQIFQDAESWSDNHPEEARIEVDPDGLLKQNVDAIDRMLAELRRRG